jgi:phosphatidylglycerophosphate synthase
MSALYSYRSSVKSGRSDEVVNTYLMRPLAGIVVRLLYPTRVTPNQVTLASTAAGLVAAVLFARGAPTSTALGGVFVFLKDLLDSADGQLARARAVPNRTGRFLDSIGDALVNVAVFCGIGATLSAQSGNSAFWLLSLTGCLGLSLRVSYHVYYQTSFLHLLRSYQTNRVSEEIREEDLQGDRQVLLLQRVFLLLYGWQDHLAGALDRWSAREVVMTEPQIFRWYSERTALRLSGLIGIGTELFILVLFSLFNRLEVYLWWNVIGMNAIWLSCVAYRRWVVGPGLRLGSG